MQLHKLKQLLQPSFELERHQSAGGSAPLAQVQAAANTNAAIDPAAINPADFVSVIDNPYFPLQPGTTFFFQNSDGTSGNEFVVTRRTIKILGVTCVVVTDTATDGGEVVEFTFDYFAQDKFGNVWYFGEDTQELEDGEVVSTAGTWRAGVDGALPGIFVEGVPQVGDAYNQENAPGVAEDRAEVLSLDESVTAPYASVDQVMQTLDTTPLNLDSVEHKFYGQDVGLLLTENVITGEQEFLVKIKIDGTVKGDVLIGKLGTDELNGLVGNDNLNGMAGDDLLNGGVGDDELEGGAGNDVLKGDVGNDELDGGEGNDALDGGLGADDLDGGAGDDNLKGGLGSDHLEGGAGNDSFDGGLGRDVFEFGADSGLDVIHDFKPNQDRLDVSDLFEAFSEVQGVMSQTGANVVIALSLGNQITLDNVNLTAIDANEFVF